MGARRCASASTFGEKRELERTALSNASAQQPGFGHYARRQTRRVRHSRAGEEQIGADAYIARPTRPRAVKESQHFVALGELKGGIDPAGADEHWKTASAHLARIRRSFAALGVAPALFFIGNAIETSMAGEIWGMLEQGELTNAANMTDDRQAVSLVSWLCKL